MVAKLILRDKEYEARSGMSLLDALKKNKKRHRFAGKLGI